MAVKIKFGKPQYESVIKIEGRRILPPLLDNARRAEMLHYKSLALNVEEKIQRNRSRRIRTEGRCYGSDSGVASNSDMVLSRVPSSSPTLRSYSEITVEDEVTETGSLRQLSTINSSFSDSCTLQNLDEEYQDFNVIDHVNRTDLPNIANLDLAEYKTNEQFSSNRNEILKYIDLNNPVKDIDKHVFTSSDISCNNKNNYDHMFSNITEHNPNLHQFSSSQNDYRFYNGYNVQQTCYLSDCNRNDNVQHVCAMTDCNKGDNTLCDNSPESLQFTNSTDLGHYVNSSGNIINSSRPYSVCTRFDNYLDSEKQQDEAYAAGEELYVADKETNYGYETSEFLPLNVDCFKLQRSSDNRDFLSDSQESLVSKQFETKNNSEINLSESVVEKDYKNDSPEILSEHEDDENLVSPRRLVRSNSYILEAPSPELLSHLRKLEICGSSDNNVDDKLQKKCELNEELNVNSGKLHNNYISSCTTEVTYTFHGGSTIPLHEKTSSPGGIATSETFMHNHPTSGDCFHSSISSESQNVNDKSLGNGESSNLDNSMRSNINHSEKTSHHSANKDDNTGTEIMRKTTTEKTDLQPVNVCKQSLAQTSIEDMYLALQAEFRDQLIELLAAQKRQQEELKKKFSHKQGKLLEDIRDKCLEIVPETSTQSNTAKQEYCEVQQVSKNVNIHHSSIMSCVYSSDQQSVLHYSNYIYKSPNQQKLQPETLMTMRRVRKLSCSRQLFPDNTLYAAATRITATVKGYLVRRLIKTERVQNLIYTIKDTLKYAHDVEQECLQDSATSSDVDLHRRLIQQVEAAYQNIHDIFFKLTTKEKMVLISNDRELLRRRVVRTNSGQFPPSAATRKSLERKMLSLEVKKNSSVQRFYRPCNFRSEKSTSFSAKNSKSAEILEKSKEIKRSPRKSLRRSYSDAKKPWY